MQCAHYPTASTHPSWVYTQGSLLHCRRRQGQREVLSAVVQWFSDANPCPGCLGTAPGACYRCSVRPGPQLPEPEHTGQSLQNHSASSPHSKWKSCFSSIARRASGPCPNAPSNRTSLPVGSSCPTVAPLGHSHLLALPDPVILTSSPPRGSLCLPPMSPPSCLQSSVDSQSILLSHELSCLMSLPQRPQHSMASTFPVFSSRDSGLPCCGDLCDPDSARPRPPRAHPGPPRACVRARHNL